MEAIPLTLSEITTEWVAAQMHTGKLKGIKLEPMGEGVGMMSAMAVCHLEWGEAEQGPSSIVIKLAASNETNRTWLNSSIFTLKRCLITKSWRR